MSTPTPAPVATPRQALPGPEAYNVILQQAYVPAWREKLASVYGIQPAKTPEEERSRLEITAALRQKYEQEQQKQAAAGNPAINLLREQLGLPTVAAAEPANMQPAGVKQAAATLSFNPDLAHAVLSLMASQPAT